jgi:DNA-binding MarR family transcriptional regulator
MENNPIHTIEHEISMLVRLATAYSSHLGELDRSGYLLLSKLVQNGPIAINALADELKLNLSTASRQVSTLEAKELIKRFPDEKNGRTSLVEITAKGVENLEKVQHARYRAYAAILTDWSEGDLKTLETMLSRLNQDLFQWKK